MCLPAARHNLLLCPVSVRERAASPSHYASFKEELMCASPFLYKPIKIPMQMTGFII